MERNPARRRPERTSRAVASAIVLVALGVGALGAGRADAATPAGRPTGYSARPSGPATGDQQSIMGIRW
jgi:hypothetical protein